MSTETQAVALLIRIMPLVRREFSHSIDSRIFFNDLAYADAILEEAHQAKDERIVRYSLQLRLLLNEMTRGSITTIRGNVDIDLPVESTTDTPGQFEGNSSLRPNPTHRTPPQVQRYIKTLR